MSRTNIDIDDELMAAAMGATGKATKKAAVEEALRHYVRVKALRNLVEGMRGIGWDAPPFEDRAFAEAGVIHHSHDKP
jgi:Arc/MetJ family transcription regulator